MRIFIGLAEVSGRNAALARGFEQLGHSVTFVRLSLHRAEYESHREPSWARVLRRLATARRHCAASRRVKRRVLRALELALTGSIFLHLIATHDVFIYSFGATFFRYWDYRLIRRCGKRLICQFHGSDSRPPYLNGAYATLPGFSIDACVEAARRTKAMIRTIDRLANEVIDLPAAAYFHERVCISRMCVGLPSGPYDAGAREADEPPTTSPPVRILHAPSKIVPKGTPLIRESVQRLVDKGYAIQYIEITGRPHREVLAELPRADLVVHELYGDYGMSAFTCEAAWFAKPVITSGHAVDFWKQTLKPEQQPPTVYCAPEEFDVHLERLVADRGLREDLGQKMRAYVEREHHPVVVARRYLAVAFGDVPESWRFDPREMRTVVGGFFMPAEAAKAVVRSVVAAGGVESLQLSDKPGLERAMIEWAGLER